MTTFEIVERDRVFAGDTTVRSSGGSPRPLVANAQFITGHYTGVSVRYADVGDTVREINSIHSSAVAANKPWEYNYVIHQDDDVLIHEYAGHFRAAHSAGQNGFSFGVLFLNGTDEPITPLQYDKFRWLRAVLLLAGDAPPDPGLIVRAHRDMPKAATLCPGSSWAQALAEQPWTGDGPPPDNPPPSPGPAEGYYLVRPGDSPWKVSAAIHGTGTRWQEIVDANSDDAVMNPGERWAVPVAGISGEWTKVRSGEGAWAVLTRVNGAASGAMLAEFYKWNGGDPDAGERDPLQIDEDLWVRH